MTRPRLLDLFSCAGGAAMGYRRAGFDIEGVDIVPQPRYPFTHHVGDALEFFAAHWREFDAFHASPPCQGYTTMSNRYRGQGGPTDDHPLLIADVRAAFTATGRPYVIENVDGARKHMRSPLRLTGGMFGLRVERPRLFETNVLVMQPHPKPIGVYGRHHDGRRLWTRSDGTELRCASSLQEGRNAMGIDWMEWAELTEAIPPAMTEHIGGYLIDALVRAA